MATNKFTAKRAPQFSETAFNYQPDCNISNLQVVNIILPITSTLISGLCIKSKLDKNQEFNYVYSLPAQVYYSTNITILGVENP